MTKVMVCIAAVILIIYVIGLILPKQRKAQRIAEFNAPAEQVWEIVTNIEAQANWRSSLKEVKVNKHDDDYETWTEYPSKGPAIYFTMKLKKRPTRFEFEMSDRKTWKGHWVGEFSTIPNHKTRVAFTECSEITNPFIRVLSYLFFDIGATIDQYLNELANKLGEKYQNDK